MEAGSNNTRKEVARLNHFIKSLKHKVITHVVYFLIFVKNISLGTTGDFTHLFESFNPTSQRSIAHLFIISYFISIY